MRQFIHQAAVILVSAVEEDLLRAVDKVWTLQAATPHCKVISNLSGLSSQQTASDNIPSTPFPCMLKPGPSPAYTASNYRTHCSSKNNKASQLQCLCFVQRLRRISLQGDHFFCHVSVNSRHSSSHTNKIELRQGISKLVRNNNR